MRATLLLLLAVGIFMLLSEVSEVVQLLVVSALLAYLLAPLARWLEGRGVHRTVATAIIFVGISIVIGIGLYFLFPLLAAQVEAMQEGLTVQEAGAQLRSLEQTLDEKLAAMGIGEANLINRLQLFLAAQVADATGYAQGLATLIGYLALVPFLVFFLLKDGPGIRRGIVNLVPNRYFEFTLSLLHKMDVQLGNYLRGQFLDALIVGGLWTLVLWVLEVPYFILIGALVGLVNVIPYIGPVTGMVLAVLVSVFTTGAFGHVVPIIIAFAGIQLLDTSFIQPMVLARNVKLHPVLVVVSLIIGAKFFHLIGLILAVPTAAVIKVMLQELHTNLRGYHLA